MRVLLVGDVAGHLNALDEVLRPFNVSVLDAEIPESTIVVQVGDLVGRCADSAALIDAVDRFRRHSPERWVQLAGNHELHHLDGYQFEGTCELPDTAVETMRRWLADGWLRIAASFEVGTTGVFVSHAGLTRGLWAELGSPRSAGEAASALESLRPQPGGWETINRSGRMLSLGRFPITNTAAGPIWAEASSELLPAWVEHEDLPFDQVHGHSSAYDWFRGRLRNTDLGRHCEIDRERRHVIARAGEHTITGIDPGLGRDGHSRWAPLELEASPST